MSEIKYDSSTDEFGDMHISPEDDHVAHQLNLRCPCQPYWDEANRLKFLSGAANKKIYIHRYLKDEANQN